MKPSTRLRLSHIKRNVISNRIDYFYRNYTKVLNVEQRNRYKADFTSEYDEYMKLFDYITKISQTFHRLSKKLAAARPATNSYQVCLFMLIRALYMLYYYI